MNGNRPHSSDRPPQLSAFDAKKPLSSKEHMKEIDRLLKKLEDSKEAIAKAKAKVKDAKIAASKKAQEIERERAQRAADKLGKKVPTGNEVDVIDNEKFTEYLMKYRESSFSAQELKDVWGKCREQKETFCARLVGIHKQRQLAQEKAKLGNLKAHESIPRLLQEEGDLKKQVQEESAKHAALKTLNNERQKEESSKAQNQTHKNDIKSFSDLMKDFAPDNYDTVKPQLAASGNRSTEVPRPILIFLKHELIITACTLPMCICSSFFFCLNEDYSDDSVEFFLLPYVALVAARCLWKAIRLSFPPNKGR